jgi:hypothetical protein
LSVCSDLVERLPLYVFEPLAKPPSRARGLASTSRVPIEVTCVLATQGFCNEFFIIHH